jgi:hypothetical protein
MAWQRTLGEMVTHGTLLAITCDARACKAWTPVDPADLALSMGDDACLWDKRPACPKCNGVGHYMVSPGQSTPFRLMRVPDGREVQGVPRRPQRRDYTATELRDFSPLDLKEANMDLSVFCPSCRVLRGVSLGRLVARRGVQPLVAMKFRCSKCRGPGSAFLSWRDSDGEPRAFDFSEAGE